MRLIINNKEEIISDDIKNISDLIQYKKYSFPKIIVKLNNIIIEPDKYKLTTIKQDDNVILLHLLAGG